MKPSIERARQLVRQYSAGGSPEMVEAVAQRMVAQDECVWHAAAQVTGKQCWCADCRPDARRFA